MNWSLFNNPIATMYGPYFLVFYALCAFLIWRLNRYYIKKSLCNKRFAPPPLPKKPDAYYIAWLTNGNEAIARLALARLLHDGLVETVGKDRLVRSQKPDPTTLDESEAALLNRFSRPNSIAGMTSSMATSGKKYEAQAQKDELIASPQDMVMIHRSTRNACRAALGIGAYKLICAFVNGHSNVFFLIFMMLVIFIVYRIRHAHITRAPVLSGKGLDFLKRLRSSLPPAGNKTRGALETSMLAFALLGTGALASGAFAADAPTLQSLFAKQTGNSSSGGCGGSSCSGSSCGGSGGGGCGGD